MPSHHEMFYNLRWRHGTFSRGANQSYDITEPCESRSLHVLYSGYQLGFLWSCVGQGSECLLLWWILNARGQPSWGAQASVPTEQDSKQHVRCWCQRQLMQMRINILHQGLLPDRLITVPPVYRNTLLISQGDLFNSCVSPCMLLSLREH